MSEQPQGVVAVIVGPTGHEMANAACWSPDKPAGLSVQEAQQTRARQRLAYAMLRACCHDDVAAVVDGHQAERIMEKLCRDRGWKVHIIPVNHEQE